MNERIRELAEQAGATLIKGYIELSDGQLMLSDGADVDHTTMDLTKFAELIVRECANILNPNGEFTEKYKTAHTPGPDGLRTPLSSEQYFGMVAAEKLKENFGVKE